MKAALEAAFIALIPPVAMVAIFASSCSILQSKPKFADAADLICDGLEDFQHLHNTILTVHLLMEREDYSGALRVADELLASIDESKEVEGVRELRALIFILQGIVKGTKT